MELLKNLGVPADKIFLSADPALRLKIPSQEHIQNIFLSESIPLDKNIICISIRWWIDGSANEHLKKTLQSALDQFLTSLKAMSRSSFHSRWSMGAVTLHRPAALLRV